MFARRIGQGPQAGGKECSGTSGCPDIWELEDGDFAVIGLDITDKAAHKLPPTAGYGPQERIIRLPRGILVKAKGHIPNS